MIPTLPVQVGCPKCGAQYVAQLQSVIDVGKQPELKAALLRGALNATACSSCGALGHVSTPLLYHDPDRELLLVFVPPELNMKMADRERLVGSLVNALMSTIPTEARKGYFLNPRTVLSMSNLLDEIYKADGITEEMLERQRILSQLLQDLLAEMDDEDKLTLLIQENRDSIDYSFLLSMAALADSSAEMGQKEAAEKLLKLRDILLAELPITEPEPISPDTPKSEIVDRLLEMQDKGSRWTFALYNRPLLDYAFFQELSKRMDQAPSEEAQSLGDLRAELLQATEQLDKEAQAAREERVRLLQDVLQSPDPRQTLRERKEEIDMLFLLTVGTALRAAEKQEDSEETEQLQTVYQEALDVIQEGLPPELRLVNELLAASNPEKTEELLQERIADLDDAFLNTLGTLAKDLEAQHRVQIAQRLRELKTQAEVVVRQSGKDMDAP